MPYVNGKRVSNEEWADLYGSGVQSFHTGPSGENPGEAPEDEPNEVVEDKKPKRSTKSKNARAKAIADTTGPTADVEEGGKVV